MGTIQEIEQAVSRLRPEDLARFREWFEAFDAEDWDRQFEDDAQSGRLDHLAKKAIEDFNAGKAREL